MKKITVLCVIYFILLAPFANAEDNITISNESEKNNVANFVEDWAVNFLVNYNMGVFGGINATEYRTDKPFDIGLGIRYKNISASASVSVSFLDSFDMWAFDFSLDSYFDKVYYKAYFKHYPNLYDFSNDKKTALDIHSSGIMASFVHNNENHSLSSVVKLDKRQNVSSGSLLYGFGVFHSSLYSPTETINKYNDRQHIIYFGPGIGYSYTFVFEKGMFLNLSFVHFSNLGVNINTVKCLYIPKFEPNIIIGHHNKTWSINLKMMNYADFLVWKAEKIEIITLVSISILFSKRF